MLKPGHFFAGYEWCATDAYDPNNPMQKQVMAEIELGNGLPDVRCDLQLMLEPTASVLYQDEASCTTLHNAMPVGQPPLEMLFVS